MPMLGDVATLIVEKTRTNNVRVGMEVYKRQFYEQLSMKNKLKTQLKVFNADEFGSLKQPGEGNGIYASWRRELNREPKYDLFEKQPINVVKQQADNDVQKLILEYKHKEWLEGVHERMEKLGFKPYKK